MRFAIIGALLGATLAMPALAQDAGDATVGEEMRCRFAEALVGEKEFRKCKACHMIQSPEGEDIVKGGATGPNLYGIVGRPAAAQEGYKYSEALVALKDAG